MHSAANATEKLPIQLPWNGVDAGEIAMVLDETEEKKADAEPPSAGIACRIYERREINPDECPDRLQQGSDGSTGE